MHTSGPDPVALDTSGRRFQQSLTIFPGSPHLGRRSVTEAAVGAVIGLALGVAVAAAAMGDPVLGEAGAEATAQQKIADNPVASYVPAFQEILGGGSDLMVILLIASLLLSMNTATTRVRSTASPATT